MAWTCSATSNAGLVANLRQAGLIRSERVAQAMQATDRRCYVPSAGGRVQPAYGDAPQSIGYGATISAPHMHAHALEAMLPFLNEGARVLDVGHGSGYLLAVLHRLVGPRGHVIGIDHLPQLVEMSRGNLTRDGVEVRGEAGDEGATGQEPGDGQGKGFVRVICGDGRKGYEAGAPYDAIHVGAAAPSIPQALIDQLNAPGRLFIPVGTDSQDIWQVDKAPDGSVTRERLYGVRYVPLTDAEAQWPG